MFYRLPASHREAILERGAHILLVDDDLDSLKVHCAILQTAGFEVEMAPDGISAITAARYRRPDLVLLDLMMPGMDGGEVLQQLRRDERLRNVPVVALTGVPEWLQDHRHAAAEFDGILLKPVPQDLLISEIFRLLSLAEG